jgi:hypothetical protein
MSNCNFHHGTLILGFALSFRRRMRQLFLAGIVASGLSACGGGDPLIELQIEPPNLIFRNQVILKGSSFVPAGSICPATNEFIRIGVLGPHTVTYANAATGVTGPVFTDLWVCNSAEGRIFYWTSNVIDLAPGPNAITVRMSAPERTSEATITLQGSI